MIAIDHVSKSYAQGKVKAVDDLCMHVQKGEIFGFIGPNGAGKSTTIKMMTGILDIPEGSIHISGIDISKDPIAAKKRVGYVPEAQDMYDRLTGHEYLNFIADMYDVPSSERKAQMDKYLKMFSLDTAIPDLIKSYSHGMRQKLLITAALLHSPDVWILDEPMVGLDPKSSHLLKEEMRRHAQSGHAVFFSTHVLEVAEKLCDRIGIIDKGKLVASGTLEELRAGEKGESLEQLFLQLTDDGDGAYV